MANVEQLYKFRYKQKTGYKKIHKMIRIYGTLEKLIVLWIRIRIKLKSRIRTRICIIVIILDPYPHQSDKQDADPLPDAHQNDADPQH